MAYFQQDSRGTQDPAAYLRKKFGFDCSCRGCTRPVAERQRSAERIAAYTKFVDDLPKHYGLRNAFGILKDIEKQLLIICNEGHVGEISSRAYDAFQLCAMHGDADSARKWEELVRDESKLYCGGQSPEVEKAVGLVMNPSSFRQWGVLKKTKLFGPVCVYMACRVPFLSEHLC